MNTEKKQPVNMAGQDFMLLAPTLEKYAAVPGSLITILMLFKLDSDKYGSL